MVKYEIKKTYCRHYFIKRNESYKFIIMEYFNGIYYKNIDFVKQVLKIYFMHPTNEQNNNYFFVCVEYRR
jgi:hypothetical protein